MTSGIANIFTLMSETFAMIIANPLFATLIGIIVVSFVIGIVTSVFNRRRRRSRR